MVYVYMRNRMLATPPYKEWNNAIWSNLNGARDDHTKWIKSERQIAYDIAYMWNLRKW